MADILDFKADHPADEVILLSDDASARMRARKHGIPTVEPPQALMLPEMADERDEQLRQLEQTCRTLSETQPKLELAFVNGTREMQATVASFNQQEFEDLLRRVTTPEPEEHESTAPDFLSQSMRIHMPDIFLRTNPQYDDQLVNYGEKFHHYFLKSWVETFRTIEIAPVIYSRNGVQARVVNLRIAIKTAAEVLSKLPEAAKAPSTPRRMLNIVSGHPFGATSTFLNSSITFPKQEFKPYSLSITQEGTDAIVTYAMMRLAQEDETVLDPFYLVFDHGVAPSRAIQLSYELRAENLTGVVRDKLLVKIAAPETEIPALYSMDDEV